MATSTSGTMPSSGLGDFGNSNGLSHGQSRDNHEGRVRSVDDRASGQNWPGNQDGKPQMNVGEAERWASLIGGTALLVSGIRKGGLGGLSIAALGGGLLWRGSTGHCSLYQAMNIDTAGSSQKGIHVVESITVEKPVAEVYQYWRHLENLPRIMDHLESVREIDHRRSHWKAKAPLGQSVEWDAEIINVRENEMIAWRSVGDADVDNAGSVAFESTDDGRSTIVTATIQYNPPGGTVGAKFARLFGEEPSVQVAGDLKRFKRTIEQGA